MSWPLVRGVFILARSGSVQAAAVLDYGPPSVEKTLGALPVVRDVLARLGLVETIDRDAAIGKARADLARVHRNLGTRYYRDEAAVAAHVAMITAERRVGRWLRTHLDTDPDTGTPQLVWHFDAETLTVDEAADGWFALLRNLTVAEADAPARSWPATRARKPSSAATRRSRDRSGSPRCSCRTRNASTAAPPAVPDPARPGDHAPGARP